MKKTIRRIVRDAVMAATASVPKLAALRQFTELGHDLGTSA